MFKQRLAVRSGERDAKSFRKAAAAIVATGGIFERFIPSILEREHRDKFFAQLPRFLLDRNLNGCAVGHVIDSLTRSRRKRRDREKKKQEWIFEFHSSHVSAALRSQHR